MKNFGLIILSTLLILSWNSLASSTPLPSGTEFTFESMVSNIASDSEIIYDSFDYYNEGSPLGQTPGDEEPINITDADLDMTGEFNPGTLNVVVVTASGDLYTLDTLFSQGGATDWHIDITNPIILNAIEDWNFVVSLSSSNASSWNISSSTLSGSGVVIYPEPATLLLFGSGLLGLAGLGRKFKNRKW